MSHMREKKFDKGYRLPADEVLGEAKIGTLVGSDGKSGSGLKTAEAAVDVQNMLNDIKQDLGIIGSIATFRIYCAEDKDTFLTHVSTKSSLGRDLDTYWKQVRDTNTTAEWQRMFNTFEILLAKFKRFEKEDARCCSCFSRTITPKEKKIRLWLLYALAKCANTLRDTDNSIKYAREFQAYHDLHQKEIGEKLLDLEEASQESSVKEIRSEVDFMSSVRQPEQHDDKVVELEKDNNHLQSGVAHGSERQPSSPSHKQ